MRGKQTQILGGQQRGNGSAKMISMAMQFIIINLRKNIESIHFAFEMIRPYENAALVNAASVKNDVYLWIHTIKRHIVMI